VQEVDARIGLELFHRQVLRAADTNRCVREFARLLLASAMNSCSVFAVRPVLTMSKLGKRASSVTGTKSSNGSKPSFIPVAGRIV
jgi:hypothetical protein